MLNTDAPAGAGARGEATDVEQPTALKVAVVGRFERWPWGQTPDESYLAEALAQEGASVLRLDQERFFYPMPLSDWMLFTGYPASHLRLRDWAGQCRTVLWTLDWLPDFAERSEVVESARQATLIASSDRFDWRSAYGIRRHFYLPAACEEPEPQFAPEPDIPCLFVGTLYNERRRRIAEIVRSFGGLVLDTPQSWVYGDDLARLVQRAKIVVGDNFRNDVDGYWSSRNYVVPGAGGFLLTPYVPGLCEEFEIGRHLAVYNSLEELQDRIAYWLSSDEERESIRRQGFAHVRKERSWRSRARQLLKALRETPAQVETTPSSQERRVPYSSVDSEPRRTRNRLAIVGWATASGVGREFTDALRHLPVDAAFVLQNAAKPTLTEALANTPHQLAHEAGLAGQMERFLNEHRPDVILTWEVPSRMTKLSTFAASGRECL